MFRFFFVQYRDTVANYHLRTCNRVKSVWCAYTRVHRAILHSRFFGSFFIAPSPSPCGLKLKKRHEGVPSSLSLSQLIVHFLSRFFKTRSYTQPSTPCVPTSTAGEAERTEVSCTKYKRRLYGGRSSREREKTDAPVYVCIKKKEKTTEKSPFLPSCGLLNPAVFYAPFTYFILSVNHAKPSKIQSIWVALIFLV